jgi:DNA polymerase III sliding clamp (beta) subunit (PCNA family)
MAPVRTLDNDDIFVEQADGLRPVVIKGEGPLLYVIMPMRTD